MKRKINILISAVLILLILPLQFGCNKEKLQPVQTEEQAIAEDYTKSGFDPASATWRDSNNNQGEINAVIEHWNDLNNEVFCSGNGYVLDLEVVVEEWMNGRTISANMAFTLTHLKNLGGIITASQILVGMEVWGMFWSSMGLLVGTPSTTAPSGNAQLLNLHTSVKNFIQILFLHGIQTNVCITFDGVYDWGEVQQAIVEGLGLDDDKSSYTLPVYGNSNEDDIINMQDVTYTELIILEYRDETELSDATNDGKVNMQDVTQIELMILGKAAEIWIQIN